MNKQNSQKDFLSGYNHYFYNVKRVTSNYFWKISNINLNVIM